MKNTHNPKLTANSRTLRKEMTKEGVEAAIRFCEENNCENDDVLVIYLPDILYMIILASITEKIYPSFL